MPVQTRAGWMSKWICASLFFFIAVCSVYSKAAYANSSAENKVKAAIVYKLTKFVSWPKRKQSLTLCVMGSGSINNELKRIDRKSSLGRRISVTHKDTNAALEKLCDILFIHNMPKSSVLGILDDLRGLPVLTISDMRGFADEGGMIGLKRDGKKMTFTINMNSAKAANFKISSQLLKLARVIQ